MCMNMTMIPRVNDYIHIKDESWDTYHLVFDVSLEAKRASCLATNAAQLDQCYISVSSFVNKDEIK